MLKKERLLILTEIVNQEGIITVADIVKQLNVSDMTVRGIWTNSIRPEKSCASTAEHKVSATHWTRNSHIRKNKKSKKKKRKRLPNWRQATLRMATPFSSGRARRSKYWRAISAAKKSASSQTAIRFSKIYANTTPRISL